MIDKVIVSLIGIIWLETVALYLGHNGLLLTGVIAVIAGLGGYEVKEWLTKR